MSTERFSRRQAIIAAALAGSALAIERASSRVLAQDLATQDRPALPPLPPASGRETRIKVVATIPLLEDLAWQIGGVRVNVASLTGPADDLHQVELDASAVDRLTDGDIVLRFGLSFDRWAARSIQESGANDWLITRGVATIPIEGDANGDVDPHVWFDPRNVKVMAVNVAEALSSVDAVGTDSIIGRLDAYQRQLDALDEWIAARIESIPPERRVLVTAHAVFAYFARRYGLTPIGSAIPGVSTRNRVTRDNTAAVLNAILTSGVPAVFAERPSTTDATRAIADEASVELVDGLYGDNLGAAESGAESYLDMMIWNTNILVEHLG